jgi:hypothetical protein
VLSQRPSGGDGNSYGDSDGRIDKIRTDRVDDDTGRARRQGAIVEAGTTGCLSKRHSGVMLRAGAIVP